jgi:hypothetical protein
MKHLEKSLLFLSLLILLGIAVSEVHSFDVFWQLQSGKYMLQTRSFIYTDIFSLAADVGRFEHCWLHDIIFYGGYLLLGYAGISLLKGTLIFATAAVLVAAARLRGASYLSILLLAPAAFFLTRGGWLERPQLWTFLLFAVFILVLERFRQTGGNIVFLLFPLMVLWANLHAGSVLAFAVAAAYLVGEGGSVLLKRSALPKGAFPKLVGVFALLGVASLITPYGTMVLKTLLHAPSLGGGGGPTSSGGLSGSITQIFNMDWRATTFFRDPFFFYLVGLCGALLLLGWRRLTLSDLFLLGGLALMGFKLSRHTPFLFFGAAAILPLYADAAVQPLIRRTGKNLRLGLRLGGILAACWIFFHFAAPAYRTYGLFNLGLREWHYPIEAAEFVREHKLPRNLYNTYDWGGYLMWALYPDYLVFWDGRSDSVEMFEQGLQVMGGHPRWEGILDRFEVKTIVTKTCSVDTGQHYPIIDLLRQSPKWALVFADESSLVFVRDDAVDPGWLKRHRLPDHRADDSILSEALLLTRVEPGRYNGYWEIARVYLLRKEYQKAFDALERHLAYAPPGKQNPSAEYYYRSLYPLIRK